MRKTQSGFTLVEIAIVLVIIGILLGGILKGQEMITSARVRALADQGNSINAAVNAFRDRFRALPGDYVGAVANIPGAVPGGTAGVTNGQILTAENAEIGAAWQHLASAGFLGGTYTGAANANNLACPTTICPANAFNGTMILVNAANGLSTAGTALTLRSGNLIPVGVLAELDRKIDDGAPGTGTFRADTGTNTCYVGAGPAATYTVTVAAPPTSCSGVYTAM